MSKNEFIHPIRVYIEDTDAGGIVYYVNYLKYFERSRTEFLRSLGYGKAAVLEGDLLLVARSTEIDYLLPARLDDEIIATACLQKVAKTYVIFEQEVRRNSDLLCRAVVKIACVAEKTGIMRPVAMPVAMRDSLNNYMVNDG